MSKIKNVPICHCYHEIKNKRHLSDFERGVIFGKTGKRVDYVDEVIGVCWGVKDTEQCKCKGIEKNCDFYKEKRE